MFGGQTGGTGSSQEDPMLQMMQQLMGGGAGLDQPLFRFTTIELILQSSRFFLEKSHTPLGSWVTRIESTLPHRFGTWPLSLDIV
ncbi:hypothetical protein B9Z19DRAFT_1135188 [Tuber borchii]|uniref:Uncharacterized protein n=1 Tax=Tuber borchii TaxID=42251 RepID=A0A2T6ZD44_TUBBO|nr:hypothetical protein B9Z19DRAFT_1135188 [Tuber borchii]